MTRALTRTHFHSSRLLRILTDLACVDGGASGGAFAERLGLWVDYTDAITLCAVHNSAAANLPAIPAPAQPVAAAEFARQRASLERAIASSSPPPPDAAEAAVLEAEGLTARDIGNAFEPYRRYYLAQQRELELKLPPLRSRVRDTLAQGSTALRQLAALDAALEGILAEREGRLLAALPQLLRKRFTHLLKNQAGLQPAAQPGAWLADFCQELQTVLLAELDLRLQPALGLIEALSHDTTRTP